MNKKYIDFNKLSELVDKQLELVNKQREEQGLPPLDPNEYGRYNRYNSSYSSYRNSSNNTLHLTRATNSMLNSIL